MDEWIRMAGWTLHCFKERPMEWIGTDKNWRLEGRVDMKVADSELQWTQNNWELGKRHSKREEKVERARGERDGQQYIWACIAGFLNRGSARDR
jgi:hypothetical protein